MSRRRKKKNRFTPVVLLLCAGLVVSSVLINGNGMTKDSVSPPSNANVAASNIYSTNESDNYNVENTSSPIISSMQVEYNSGNVVQDVSTSADETKVFGPDGIDSGSSSNIQVPINVAPPTITEGAPDLSLQSSAADDYFKDACFIGNSLVDGLHLYSGVTTCDWLCSTGLSIYNIGSQKVNGDYTVYDSLNSKQYNKVYILLGINEIGADANSFIASLSSIVDKVRSYQPNATIYIMSLTPVSLAKNNDGGYFTKDKVLSYNNAIHSLCADKGLWYLDCYTPLANEDGFLPANVTFDGIHLDAATYKQWFDNTIRTHYI